MSLMKKVLLTMAAVFILTSSLSFLGLGIGENEAEASVISNIKSKDKNSLTTFAKKATDDFVKVARDIGIYALVFIIIWMGYSVFIKKSAEGLADMKGRLGLLILIVVFVFFTEDIIGTLFGILGYKV